MGIFDIIGILGGLALIAAPKWAYNFGRKEPMQIPKNWPIVSRILGVFFIALSAFFIYYAQS